MPYIRQGDSRQPLIYALDKRGAGRLGEEIGITVGAANYKPKNAEHNPSYLRHFLMMNDIRIALERSCEKNKVTLAEWISDKELKATNMKDYVTLTGAKGSTQRAAVVPDACFTLDYSDKQALFFVELDLGTVTVRPSLWERRGWVRKIQAYQVYLASDAYAKRYGGKKAQVLTITTTDKRSTHLRQATEAVDVGMDFWFTTFEQATDPLLLLSSSIWHRAGVEETYSILEK